MLIPEHKSIITQLEKIVSIFKASEGELRPHFMITGPSGSGKSATVQYLAETHDLEFLEVNAAQLTKEGTAGNSLSKALSPLLQKSGQLTICFVDEFDKLFISGNSNCSLAHESTNGVQNEFLKILEADEASVFGDYGKYINTSVKNVLFVFAGAFNGEEDITIDRLRDFGIKTEFIGRVGLVYNLPKISLDSMLEVLQNSDHLNKYLNLFTNVSKPEVIDKISAHVKLNYEKNTMGIRYINSLITQYFISGGKLQESEVKKISFNKTLTL